METVRTVAELRARVRAFKGGGAKVGFVPTMGALHEGHLSLVRLAGKRAEKVVASIFVNPAQFGPDEDFAKYPRTEAADLKLLESAGAALAFLPPVEEIYPEGFATAVSVPKLSKPLCGIFRPGHFEGVATVVAKLLNACEADVAVFGEKDYQQLLVIRQMAKDLDIPTEIVAGPTYREADGLAASSRNAYLKPDERAIARLLPKTLTTLVRQANEGQDLKDLSKKGRDV
ncbi:MAG TPA: pantoate--beta-alanine ligase, partial [Sphingomonadales bacterium]|nr:pantoate--beta-alanine ligase [Sphingomonadales bacterium]